MATTEHTIVLRSKADTRGIDDFNKSVKGFNQSLSGVNSLLRYAGVGAITTYVSQGVRALINSQIEMSNSLARVRFHLRGVDGQFSNNLQAVQKFGAEMQKVGYATNTFAQEIGAKSLKAFRDQDKALQVARVTLLGHKIQLFDANTALNAMIDAQNGNTDALRNFLRQIGVAAPEFASFETLIQNLTGAIDENDIMLTDFGRSWETLSGVVKQRSSEMGKWIGDALAGSVEGLAYLIENPREAFDAFLMSFEGFFKDIGKIITGKGDEATNFWALFLWSMYDVFYAFGARLRDIWVSVFTWIGEYLVMAVQRAYGSVMMLSDLIGQAFGWMRDKVVRMWQGMWNFLLSIIQGITGGIVGAVSAVLNFVALAFVGAYGRTMATWSNMWNGIKNIGTAIMSSIQGAISAFIDSIIGQVNRAVDAVKSAVMKIPGAQTVVSTASKVTSTASKVTSGASNTVKAVSTALKNTSLASRLTSLAKAGGSALAKTASKVLSGLKKKAGGGSVTGGEPYMVGEQGAELFVPSRSGVIVPNHSLGGGTTLNVTVTGNTFMSDDRDVAVKIGNMIIERLSVVHRFGLSV